MAISSGSTVHTVPEISLCSEMIQNVSESFSKYWKSLEKKIVIVIVQQICRRHPSALQEATHV